MGKLGVTALAALGLVLMAGLAGCHRGGFAELISPADLNILRIAKASDPQSLDPAFIQDVDTTDEMQQIFQGLTEWGPNLSIEPCLATDWKIVDGGKRYVFNLRKGVQFSNGDPFDAYCVKYSIDRACNPRLKSSVADEYLNDIEGVEESVQGKAVGVSGVRVLDKYTIEITLKRPVAYFLGKFAYNTSWVVDPKVVPFNAPITNISMMVGTGPFVCTQYDPGSVINMKPNPHFWGHKPDISGIRYVIAKEPTTREELFLAHQVDIVGLSAPEASELQQEPDLEKDLRFFPRMGVEYLAMNQDAYAPFANVHVRRAVAMAISSNQIVNDIGGKIDSVATGILPPGVLGFRKTCAALPFDPAAAMKELKLAGYSDGSQLPPLKIYISSGNIGVQRDAEVIQNNLITNLHMPVELGSLTSATLYAKEDAKQLPAYILGWYADYPDPQDFISLTFTTWGAENHIGYFNAQVDALCSQADYMPQSSKERLAMYAKAEDIVLQEAAWKPISFMRAPELVDKRVTGIEESIYCHAPMNHVVLKNEY